jgi:hypothetical protein
MLMLLEKPAQGFLNAVWILCPEAALREQEL